MEVLERRDQLDVFLLVQSQFQTFCFMAGIQKPAMVRIITCTGSESPCIINNIVFCCCFFQYTYTGEFIVQTKLLPLS